MASSLPKTYVEGFHDVELVKKMTYRPLGGDTGIDVSVLSFGASSIGSAFRPTDEEESIAVVHLALKAGINWIDTSPWYGHGKSEEVLGKALKGIPRDAYYIATKCGRYNPKTMEMFDFSAERVTKSVHESLERLGLDYLDVIQVHDPEFAPNAEIIMNETLPALHKLKLEGKVKMIGMTGYPMDFQRKVIEGTNVKVDTCLTYCHYSMNDYSLLKHLDWLKEQKLGVINASAISMGLLSSRGPPVWHPALPHQKEACAAAAIYCTERGVDLSKLAMHFSLSHTDIPTTLVSTASLKRMQDNINSCYETLTEKEQQVSNEVMEKYFKPIEGNEQWIGIEVKSYWQKVAMELAKETMASRLYGK